MQNYFIGSFHKNTIFVYLLLSLFMSVFCNFQNVNASSIRNYHHNPNIEWKTKVANGITYVFWEGNPKEVAVSSNEIGDYYSCSGKFSKRLVFNECPESRYITPEIEMAIKKVLQNNIWKDFIIRCNKKVFHRYDGGFDGFVSDLDIEKFINIDEVDGMKKIRWDTYQKFISFFPRSSSDQDDIDSFSGVECTKIGNQIWTMLSNIYGAYSTYALIYWENNSQLSRTLNHWLIKKYRIF